MPEMTFRSPNFFDREIDQSAPTTNGVTGTPAGVIGTANKGPAFVPITVADRSELSNVFGNLDARCYGLYAANEYLKNGSALTYCRVLGAGANTTTADILATQTTDRVKNAGFKMVGTATPDLRHNGAVQYIAAQHTLQASQDLGAPMFTDNDTFTSTSVVNVIRGMVMLPSTSRMMILNGDESAVGAFTGAGPDDAATLVGNRFKLVISSTLGNAFSNVDGSPGIRIYTASLNPTDTDYYAKILNSDPSKFVSQQHMLYADFPVDAELAVATAVAVLSGTTGTSTTSAETATTFRAAYGAFDTRYKTPKTSYFISQPFGKVDYDLFQLEALDDGEYANTLYKTSISNLKASVDASDPYGTFTVEIRDWNDSDANPRILESFPNCSLNPVAKNYIAALIGDRKVFYNFDAVEDSERRIATTGRYNNLSKYVRVVMADAVERSLIPASTLPFGFRGQNVLKTTETLTDDITGKTARVGGVLTGVSLALSGAVLPPIPFQYKVTRGERNGATWSGQPGATELATSQLYWGVRFERFTDALDPNTVSERNLLLNSYTKFIGNQKLDTLVTGSGADTFNNNKFTLAKVAFAATSIANLTSSLADHMREAAYIRNAKLDATNQTIVDAGFSAGTPRITFATLLAQGTPAQFNRFSPYMKFTNFLAGGYNGVNFLDDNASRLNDKASSFDASGGAETNYVSPGFVTNQSGVGTLNATVNSYVKAVDIMTDPMQVNHNVLIVPGIRESYITDKTMSDVRDYGLAYYVMDIPAYDDSGNRLYDDDTTPASVEKTASGLETRAIDNNYVGTYWPDVSIEDETNKHRVFVPASVAAAGAISFNDRVRYPWFAPAGFNRASLDFVKNVKVRLNVPDRDRLQDARINPIAIFPRLGFVVWGQKTMQLNKSSLDRVNVRRMLLEVKRIVIDIARRTTFEQNTPAVRNDFIAKTSLQLGLIKSQQGMENFRVIMNETNNTQNDIDLNRLNGRIVVVPTRTVEYITVDFIVSNSGVIFG